MTQSGFTYIAAVLDRSGSMAMIKDDTEGGYNSFVGDQVKATDLSAGETCVFSLTQFDTQVDEVYSMVAAGEVESLKLQPRGGTALLDAVGQTIVKTGERLAAMDEDARPEHVIFVIMTDGQENSSREWTREQLNAAITRQREQYSWEFVFLAANQDAIQTGASMGIPQGSSLTYAASARGVAGAMGSVSNYVTVTRSGSKGSFSDKERAAAG